MSYKTKAVIQILLYKVNFFIIPYKTKFVISYKAKFVMPYKVKAVN